MGRVKINASGTKSCKCERNGDVSVSSGESAGSQRGIRRGSKADRNTDWLDSHQHGGIIRILTDNN